MAEKCLCEHCGATMMKYKHSFSQALAIGLGRLYAVKVTNLKSLGLDRNQWDNFQKLRYWGLVAKTMDDNGKRVGGTWEITPSGIAFVEGRSTIAKGVETYRGEVTSYLGKQVKFSEAEVGYRTREDYANDAEPV